MKIIICLIVICLSINCQNSQQGIKVVAPLEEMNIVNDHEVLDNEIIIRLKKYMSVIRQRTDSVLGLCYIIKFYKGSPDSLISKKDTVIMFSYYARGQDYSGYRGVIYFIDDYPIAIVDSSRIGTAFYSENDLIDSPLNKFEAIEVDSLRMTYLLKLKNGELKSALGGIGGEF